MWELWSYLTGGEPSPGPKEASSVYERRDDVVYGRKDGMGLTLDVFSPRSGSNGRGLIWVVSGIWFSAPEAVLPIFIEPLVARGYTVFAVLHSSQPRYTIPDILPDIRRAVRFVRHEADRVGIDPQRIGIYGGSSGGHLALMQAVTGKRGTLLTLDPVDRVSSRVQAAAVFFPPTDFLNWGKLGEVCLGTGPLQHAAAAFAFHRFEEAALMIRPITDEKEVLRLAREISPAEHVSKDDPPVLLIHGDADPLVPLQQSEWMAQKLERAGATVELRIKLPKDLDQFADWFDRHLGEG
jgi:acetyl esterase/lipase